MRINLTERLRAHPYDFLRPVPSCITYMFGIYSMTNAAVDTFTSLLAIEVARRWPYANTPVSGWMAI